MNDVAELRSEMLIMKVFRSGYTMPQLEEYFEVSSKYLTAELKEFLHNSQNLFDCVMNKIALNEKEKALKRSYDDGFER